MSYKKEDNNYIERDDYYILQVQYKNKWYDSFLSKEDYEKTKKYHWRASHKKNKVYLVTGQSINKTLKYLHNLIMDYIPEPGYEVDHIDGNSLNNRRENLRLVDRQTNIDNYRVRIDNKIQIRGIVEIPRKKGNGFKVDFIYHGQRFYFKTWDSLEEAVYCRKYAEEYFGQVALKNNPLAQKFLRLPEKLSSEIKSYVEQVIKETESQGPKKKGSLDSDGIKVVGLTKLQRQGGEVDYLANITKNGKRYYFPKYKTKQEAIYCRLFAEEYFEISTLKLNSPAQVFLTLPEEKTQEIKDYVTDIITNK